VFTSAPEDGKDKKKKRITTVFGHAFEANAITAISATSRVVTGIAAYFLSAQKAWTLYE
jgi:hypothetical protein